MADSSSPHAIIFRIANINIGDNLGSPIDLMSDLHLFPKASALLWDSLDEATEVAIGMWCGLHEHSLLRNRSLVAYSAVDISDYDYQKKIQFLYRLANRFDGLFNTLWLWRDHAAAILPGWSLDTQSNGCNRHRAHSYTT